MSGQWTLAGWEFAAGVWALTAAFSVRSTMTRLLAGIGTACAVFALAVNFA